MTKRNLPAGKAGKIIYWIATLWLALGMVATGAGQLIKMKAGQGGVDNDYTFGLSCLFSDHTGCLENFGSNSSAYS